MPSAHPAQPTCQTHGLRFSTLPRHLCNTKSPETSFSDCKIILKNALFCSTGHILLGSPAHCSGGKPSRPASSPSSSRRAPLHPTPPGKEGETLGAAQDGLVIPLCPVNKSPVRRLSLVLLSLLQASSSALSVSRLKHPLISPSSQLVYGIWLPALCKEPPAFSSVLLLPPCPLPWSCRLYGSVVRQVGYGESS